MEPDSYTIYNDPIGDGDSPIQNGLWDNYFNPLVDFNDYVTCDDNTPLALAVLDAYGIPYNPATVSFETGILPDMDIKRMDAMTVLRNSLMEASFKGPEDKFIEAIVNAAGEVEFTEIGASVTYIGDIYYSIQTGQYVDEPTGVMVTAGKPIPKLQPLTWKPIWYYEPEHKASIYSCRDMFNNCMQADWNSFATIVFSDPHLDSNYEDGIDNLYDIGVENPWDAIMGYAIYIEPLENAGDKTTIQYNSETEIPLRIATKGEGGTICPIGVPYNMPTYDPTVEDERCWGGMTGEEVDYDRGVPVEMPERFRFETIRENVVDRFVEVSNVFIIGTEINAIYARPRVNRFSLEEINEDNSDIWVTINNKRKKCIRLDKGVHYTVAYADLDEDTFQEISIVFSQEVRQYDNITYGNSADGETGVKFRMDPLCAQAQSQEFDGGGYFHRTILPWKKTEGIMVDEVWVTVRVEIPSISVYDPDGSNNKALSIAEKLKYYLAPLVMRSPAAPIGYKSYDRAEVIDQVPLLRDNNPSTQQDFEDTDMETAMDQMQGSGMAVTFGFLTGQGTDVDEVYEAAGIEALQAAETIYNMIVDDVTETVYTCGPDARPQLGNRGPAGGIINGIKYSYSDQGSYTISVTEGPTLVGNLVQVDGGPSQKMAEDNSAKGTVVQALGDNLHFKVRIDGFGERWAINTTHHFIREKDVVQCTIHNNPVEA